MSNSMKIHLTFKSDITQIQVDGLSAVLDGSDNVRIYDYNKRSIIVLVLDRQKTNNQIFEQLASVMDCKVVGNHGHDERGDNIYLFVVPVRGTVDTSATAKAVQKLF